MKKAIFIGMNLRCKDYLLLILRLLIFTRGMNGILHLDDGVIVEKYLKMILRDLDIFIPNCFFTKFNISGVS